MLSLWAAVAGMRAQQTSLDVIANNMTNVNTPGFKRSQTEMSDVGYQQIIPGNNTIRVGMGSRVIAGSPVNTNGPLLQTGNPLDMAIVGEGFFEVRPPQGGLAYTRAGNFQLDSLRRVVSPDGALLLGVNRLPIVVPQDTVSVSILPAGTIVAQPQNGAAAIIGQVAVATFANPEGLASNGQNLYTVTANSGAAQISQGLQGGAGRVVGGFIEGSNVDIGQEMVGMIVAQRSFEASASMIKTADELMGIANNLKR